LSDPIRASDIEPQAPLAQQKDGSDLTLDERVKFETLAVFARRAMVSDSGSIDQDKVADEVQQTVVAALAEVEADRTKIGVTPTFLMERHFPEVPKRSEVQSDDEEELDFIDAVYGSVKREVFRVLNIAPEGPIQSRLADNGDGLVLCRHKGKRGTEERAYVTRNRKCIHEDNNAPAIKAVERAVAKAAALTGLSVERVPESGTWFQRRYSTEMKQITDSGQNTIRAAIEMTTDGDDPVDGGE
jgi:hypothetical protein